MLDEKLKFFDFVSPETSLFFRGSKRYFSLFGVIMTIVFMIFVVGFGMDFLMVFLEKKQIYIAYSKDSSQRKIEVDFTKKLFAFQIVNEEGEIIDPKVIQVTAGLLTETTKNEHYESFRVSKCVKENFQNERYKSLIDFDISLTNCIYPRTTKLSEILVSRSKFPISKVFLTLYVNKCRNGTLNGNFCSTSEEINNTLSKSRIYFYFNTEIISVDNFKKNPLIPALYQERIPINFSQIKNYNLIFKKFKYISDDGFMISNLNIHEDFGFSQSQSAISFPRNIENNYLEENSLLSINLSIEGKYIETYYRKKQKFQGVLADLGGMIFSVYFLAKFITIFISKGYTILSVENLISNPAEKRLLQLKLQIRDGILKQNPNLNNFVRSNNTSIQTEAQPEPNQKKKFRPIEIIFYRFCKKKTNCRYLKGIEETLKRLLDIKTFINFSRYNESLKKDPTFYQQNFRKPLISGCAQTTTIISKNEVDCSCQNLRKK